MEISFLTALWQALTIATSRRRVLAALGGGLLSALHMADGAIESEARKKRGHRKQRRNDRKKKDNSQSRVDALCPGPTDNSGFSLEDALAAQPFTALRSGLLERAELLVDASATGSADLTLQLRDLNASGVPTDNVLGESVLLTSDVPTGENTIVFSFANAPSVAASREYALVLSQRGPRSVSWKGHRGNRCDGRALLSEPSGAPFEAPIDELDLIFTTVVRS